MADDHSQTASQSASQGAAPASAAFAGEAPNGKAAARKRLFGLLGLGVLGAAILYGLYWLLIGSHYVSTDDAYVGADTALITPAVAGTVAKVHVADTDQVKVGDVLVELDNKDLGFAAAQAQALYGQAQRRVRQYQANTQSADATVAARNADLTRAAADIASAQANLERARVELQRRQNLAQSGAVSGEELTQAQTAVRNMEAALASARAAQAQAQAGKLAAQGTLAAQAALVEGAGVENNPEVAAARAAWQRAQNDFDRTVIRAPVAGVVAKRAVQVGQRVAIGAPLMSVVPVDQVYVDANFKESQLKKVRLGQPVKLKSDYYGGGVVYHGTVVGIGGGTGSAFAVIPAQNATGNWIKVVQRLPVRVKLDPKELQQNPLRVGLSMKAEVDVSHPGTEK
jgi:membrane fusion protein (multidrug efflux system)